MISTSNRNNIFRFVLVIVLLFICAVPLRSGAQNSLALSVTPTLFEMSANPGQIWQSAVKVINSNNFDITIYPSVVNFAPEGELGRGKLVPVIEEMTEGSTLAEWITLANAPVVIPAQKSREVSFTVAVPDDASPGGHFAAILISTQPPEPAPGQMFVRTSQVVTSLFFVRVAGDVIEQGSIRSFTAVSSFKDTPQADFELRFENKGNVHLQPRGEIAIYNMWGTKRGVIPINQKTHFGNVLPQSIRKFSFSWEGETSITDIGRYTAVASLGYGLGSKQFVTSKTSFWVIPVKPVLITVGTLLFIIYAVSWAIRLYVRRMLEMAGVRPALRVVQEEKKDSDTNVGLVKTITAPLQSGFLDLRQRIQHVNELIGLVRVMYDFIKIYRHFFIGLIIVALSLTAVWYFIVDVTDEDKDFAISIDNPETTLSLNAEEIAYAKIAEPSDLPDIGEQTNQSYSIALVNTSGAAGTAGAVGARLAQNGYVIKAINANPNRTDKRSVIVYNTDYQEEALALSKLLGGALLSARPTTATESEDITIYVGTDNVR